MFWSNYLVVGPGWKTESRNQISSQTRRCQLNMLTRASKGLYPEQIHSLL